MSKEITSKTKRIATILSLAETGSVSMQDLAERFGVSTRTIQRDFGLMVQAHIPFVSHQQGRLYSFAQGFCLNAANITAEQAAVLAVSYDIAMQLGGDFSVVLKDISARFAPPSFTDCDFYPDTSCLEEPFKGFILSAVKENSVIKLHIRPNNLKLYLRPCKLLRLKGKMYLASLEKDGNIIFIAIDDIVPGSFAAGGKFKRPPFLEWHIWQCVKKYLGQTPDKFAVSEVDGLKEDAPTENTGALQKGAAVQSSAETVNTPLSVQADTFASVTAAPDTQAAPETAAVPEVAAAPQNQPEYAVTFQDNTPMKQTEQLPSVLPEELPQHQEAAQDYPQEGENSVFEPSAKVKPAETKQEILPETPPDVFIPELSSYSIVLNEELSRFLNADIDSPASGIINIGAESIKESSSQVIVQNNSKDNKQESFIPQEFQNGNDTPLSEKEDKSA